MGLIATAEELLYRKTYSQSKLLNAPLGAVAGAPPVTTIADAGAARKVIPMMAALTIVRRIRFLDERREIRIL